MVEQAAPPRPGAPPAGSVVGMRVATWNVNSVRARVGRVVDWLVREDVDVVGLQEIKCKPEQFPFDAFRDAGYEVELHGLSQWNGVAFASRLPMDDVTITFPTQPGFAKGQEGPDQPKEARAIGVTVEGVRLWSLYVPNGRELGDPHYDYKLDWLAALAAETEAWIAERPDQPLALMGDWNVAPLDTDVWDVSAFEGHTHVSQPERDAFAAFERVGLTDVVRPRLPEGYTYWDYKQLRFPKNEGMRIDFIMGSAAFADLVTVVVDLDLDTELDDDRPMIF
jgi:exodeoxyribonuclease-3